MNPESIFYRVVNGDLPPSQGHPARLAIRRLRRCTASHPGRVRRRDGAHQSDGQRAGGFLSAMLDDCMGPAIYATLPANRIAVTVESKTSFVNPARPGRIIGWGEVEHSKGSIAFTRGWLTDPAGRYWPPPAPPSGWVRCAGAVSRCRVPSRADDRAHAAARACAHRLMRVLNVRCGRRRPPARGRGPAPWPGTWPRRRHAAGCASPAHRCPLGYAEAGSDPQYVASGQCDVQLPHGHAQRLGQLAAAGQIAVGEQHQEFLATVAGDAVAGAGGAAAAVPPAPAPGRQQHAHGHR